MTLRIHCVKIKDQQLNMPISRLKEVKVMPNVTDVRLPFLLECYELVPSSKDQLPVDERLHIFTILVYLVKFHKIADHQLLLKATMH